MKMWTVREARANFAALLTAARDGEPQVIRQSGLDDVEVARRSELNTDYLLAALAQRDAYEIALDHHRAARGWSRGGTSHVPPNLSGDIVQWIQREQGAFRAALYVVDATRALRDAQEQLELPLSTVAQVATGLALTAGDRNLFDDETRGWIESLAQETWQEAAAEVLGDRWVPVTR